LSVNEKEGKKKKGGPSSVPPLITEIFCAVYYIGEKKKKEKERKKGPNRRGSPGDEDAFSRISIASAFGFHTEKKRKERPARPARHSRRDFLPGSLAQTSHGAREGGGKGEKRKREELGNPSSISLISSRRKEEERGRGGDEGRALFHLLAGCSILLLYLWVAIRIGKGGERGEEEGRGGSTDLHLLHLLKLILSFSSPIGWGGGSSLDCGALLSFYFDRGKRGEPKLKKDTIVLADF